VTESPGWRKPARSACNGNRVEIGAFRKSSFSGSTSDCVEVGRDLEATMLEATMIGVRDTKAAGDRNRVTLQVPAWSWRQFTESVKSS
jgi:hypothetical protein